MTSALFRLAVPCSATTVHSTLSPAHHILTAVTSFQVLNFFFFFSSSLLWVVCVFGFLYAYSCLGPFSFFKPRLSFHFFGVVFADPYLKFLRHSLDLCFFPLYQWFSKCGPGAPEGPKIYQGGPQGQNYFY